MKNEKPQEQTREQLLDIIESYNKLAKAGFFSNYPESTLSDIIASTNYVLTRNGRRK